MDAAVHQSAAMERLDRRREPLGHFTRRRPREPPFVAEPAIDRGAGDDLKNEEAVLAEDDRRFEGADQRRVAARSELIDLAGKHVPPRRIGRALAADERQADDSAGRRGAARRRGSVR